MDYCNNFARIPFRINMANGGIVQFRLLTALVTAQAGARKHPRLYKSVFAVDSCKMCSHNSHAYILAYIRATSVCMYVWASPSPLVLPYHI